MTKPSATRTETDFKFVGLHLDDLADGRILEPYQIYSDVDIDEPHNQRLILEGLLVPVDGGVDAGATDSAAAIAALHGIDLANVPGSGKDGRITKEDVEAFIKAKEEES